MISGSLRCILARACFCASISLAMFSASALAAPASPVTDLPTADSVLVRYIKVTGGAEAYGKIKTMVATGSIEFPGLPSRGSIEIYAAPPDNYYEKQDLPVIGKVESGISAGISWSFDKTHGYRLLEGTEKAQARTDAAVGALQWRKLFRRVSMVGADTVKDRPVYKLSMMDPAGRLVLAYFDKESGLRVRRDETQPTENGDISAETYDEAYDDVGGVLLPHRKVMRIGSMKLTVDMDKIEINKEIPPDRFDLPDAVKELVKK